MVIYLFIWGGWGRAVISQPQKLAALIILNTYWVSV
jgi:hypothetical protein